MQHQDTARSGGMELGEIVERQIVQRTWGRIHRLKVDVAGERLVVRGCTASYYAKQLALEAVLDVLGSADAPAVELDIQVSNAKPRSAPEANGRWGDA